MKNTILVVRPHQIMTKQVLLLTFLVSVLLGSQGCERKLPFQEADKALLLRAQELRDYGYEFNSTEKFESFTRTKAIDGSYEIEYEFQTPEGERENPLFLYVLVVVGKQKVDAQISQGAEKLVLLYGLKAEGITEEEIPNFYRYGDSSSFYLLKKEGNPVGNYFTVREGAKTYSIIISGFYFDDPEVWKEIMEPKLKHFSVYKPT